MRIVFAGTPVFAARALRALHEAGHEVALVLTQPDRPAGRGNKVLPSPVKQLALELGLPVAQPATLRDAAAQDLLRATGAECMVVAAYGLILPQAVLDIPPRGCLNIHASLLPRWRGAAPIQRAIEAGDTLTGITIMRMEAGLDTGPMLLEASTPILDDDTGGSLHDRLAVMGAELIVQALARPDLPERIQPQEGVTYARKLERAEGRLDWREPAAVLARRVRAFDPVPGCSLQPEDGEPVKVWAAHADDTPAQASPGTVLAADAATGLCVACGEGSLWIDELQRPGGRRLPARTVLQGWSLPVGSLLRLPD